MEQQFEFDFNEKKTLNKWDDRFLKLAELNIR